MSTPTSCNGCRMARLEVGYATSDIRKLIKRAERGIDVADQIRAKQAIVKSFRSTIEQHQAGGEHPAYTNMRELALANSTKGTL